ncbi:MAG: hypothetical protein ACOYX1_04290 [Acidobacteriota bacterium]
MRRWCLDERAGIDETAGAVLASFERLISGGAPERKPDPGGNGRKFL